MRVKWILTSMLCVLLALAVPGSLRPGLAQEPDPQGTLAAQDSVGAAAAALVGTAFTYQGRLTDGSSPADGKYDFLFRLYDSDGTQIGSTVTKGDVDVTDGTFTVSLDFGSAFNGDARYLDVSVRPGSSTGGYTLLTPRQSLTAAPYALSLRPGARVRGLYGGGVGAGGSSYTNRFYVGSLPYNSSSVYEKLLVTVWGGSWYNTTLGQDFYSISSRGGLKVTRTRLFGATSMYSLKVYDNGSAYDVVVEVVAQSFPGLVVRSYRLDGNNGFLEQAVTGGYDPSGKTNVTPTIENHIVVDNAGNVGIGTASPQQRLDVNGTARTRVLQITGGSDLAEPFEIAGAAAVEPGMVVAIDPQHPGQLQVATHAYDRTVAGCVSGANGINPGLTMQQEGTPAEGAFPVALSGRVYCWADASYGPLHPGDLLTTSDTPGHVMKVTDYASAQGAIVGKAMTRLDEGRGLVLVLVTLQ